MSKQRTGNPDIARHGFKSTDDEESKSEIIQAKVTKRTKQEIEESGLLVSEFVREAVREKLERLKSS